MSDASPFSFHVVGASDEPQHFEFRDVSGRVVRKALWEGAFGRLLVVRAVGFTTICGRTDLASVEEAMRAAVAA